MYWTVCKGHLTDIGGPVPAGYNPNAKDMYAECLRIPPVKIWDKGKPRNDVINMILTNMRARRDQEGDFNALIGACQVGERNLIAMIENMARATVDACINELLDMADRHMRALIATVPERTYEGVAILEDAGHGIWRFRDQGQGDHQERYLPHRHQQPCHRFPISSIPTKAIRTGRLSRPADVCGLAATLQ